MMIIPTIRKTGYQMPIVFVTSGDGRVLTNSVSSRKNIPTIPTIRTLPKPKVHMM
ncbi:hypothetical protein [Methanolacinia petrolearia]|uniref:hypothetical protein n=1 Tax=Methanolacinia petrolearia TaxID=54120 RepID=UPI003BAA811D